MAKMQTFDNKSEGESDMAMIKGGTKPVGPSMVEHNGAAMSSRSYPKSGNGLPAKAGMSGPDDVRGDTLKPF
jgi:hypothetical protein